MILRTWEKNTFFLFFEIFIFTLFIGIFRFFPYITLVNFWFQATGHSFSPRNVIFGLREPCTTKNWRLLNFFENFIFHGEMGHFLIFLVIFQYNFGVSWDIHGMWPIILGYFFPTITMEISIFISGGYWYNHGMWYISLVCFFSTKTMGVMKIHFGHRVGKYDP